MAFLEGIRQNAASLYILGDLFEFGFEYRHGLLEPNRTLAQELSGLARSGVRVALVRGNHDCWLRDRFQRTYGIELFDSPVEMTLEGKRMLLAHGDELDRSLKTRVTRALFRSPVTSGLYSLLPEQLGARLAGRVARVSRAAGIRPELITTLREYAREKRAHGFEYVVIGHVHEPTLERIGAGYYLNCGDWITHFTYGVLDDSGLRLEAYARDDE